jgi:hypothetical protein
MKRVNRHFKISEITDRLIRFTHLDEEEANKIAVILRQYPFVDLKEIAKQIKVISRGIKI